MILRSFKWPKWIWISGLCLYTLTAHHLQAQEFQGGLFLGMSSSQINGDNLSGYNLPGFQGGFFTYRSLNDRSDVQLELSFVQKGSRELPSDTSNFYKARLNYISVPLLYRYYWEHLSFEVGPVFDILVGAEESDIGGTYDTEDSFKPLNIAGMISVNYHFNDVWWVSFRTVNSITTIRPGAAAGQVLNSPRIGGYGQRNLVLTFGVYYNFY